MSNYFKMAGNEMSSWESKGLSDEEIKSFAVSGSSTAPQLARTGDRIMLKFEEDCLKQDKVTQSHEPIINIYIVYQLYGSVTNSPTTLIQCQCPTLKQRRDDVAQR